MLGRLVWTAPLAVLAVAAAWGAPAPENSGSVGLRARAGEVALLLRRIAYRRTALYALDEAGRPAAGKVAGTAEAVLEFALGARDASVLDGIVGDGEALRARYRALDNRGRPAAEVRPRLGEAEGEPRLLLTVTGLASDAAGLSSLQGELLAHPRARRVRFHVPWLKDDLPLRVEFGGGTATLRRFQLAEDDSTLWVSVRPPEGFRLAPSSRGDAVRARAMDIYGNMVNGGGVTQTEQTAGGEEPEFRFFAPGLTRTPSRLVLDVLCVSGEARPLPFEIRGLSFPTPR